ncbi:MAG TPA: hypothetical protein VKJ45_25655, partial [Blastocatellia bacterium]|nr:hypothetical protein [Blastocatellia bacterium]
GSGDGQLEEPSGVAVDSQGNVFVADTYNSRIEVFGLAVVPRITMAALSGKRLTVQGSGFGNAPRITINGADVTGFVAKSSDDAITLKGRPGRLNLHAGDNVLLVIGANELKSAPFILTL